MTQEKHLNSNHTKTQNANSVDVHQHGHREPQIIPLNDMSLEHRTLSE